MTEMRAVRPRLALTMGDPCGVGPEIILRALADGALPPQVDIVIIGDSRILARAAVALNLPFILPIVTQAQQWDGSRRAAEFPVEVVVLDLANADPDDCPWGRLAAAAGRAAVEYLMAAVQLATRRAVDGIVTAPINKEAVNLAGIPFTGHTEMLAEQTNTPEYAMMLVADLIRVVHVSTHVSLRQACDLVRRPRVLTTIRLAHEGLRKLGIPHPRIAVAALNPHAGEHGLFGAEDDSEVAPAVADACLLGIDARGPVSADTLFLRMERGEFDGAVVMYHDQGHIPIKSKGFDVGVNVTLGLPLVRTSVDHGTAFDIAGKGIASAGSLIDAAHMAARMVSSSALPPRA